MTRTQQQFVILVVIDLVNSTKFFEKFGDVNASKAMRVYDRIFRGLLIKYSGLEIDKTDGALLLFETMREALSYCSEYHKLVEKHLKLQSRVGIHCGLVIMHSNSSVFVSRGAKPIEVDGIHKNITARIMSVANGGQTLLSRRAGEYASALSVRGKLLMKDIGVWKMKGIKNPMHLYAIGSDLKNLERPKETDKVKRVRPPALTPRERNIRLFNVFILLPLLTCSIYSILCILHILETFGGIDHYGFREVVDFIRFFPENLSEFLERLKG
ncbi:hypothetical protein CL629_02295 [bacterium]|nr:hypothetical protein [bacterium]|tara:strand:+ start:4160 stop:4969 length:810 start_codon:yes stop_codon:yes gene_type:complete